MGRSCPGPLAERSGWPQPLMRAAAHQGGGHNQPLPQALTPAPHPPPVTSSPWV